MQAKAPVLFAGSIFDAKDRYVEKYIKFFGEVRKHSNVLFSLTTIVIVVGVMFIVLGTVFNIQRIKE